MGEGMFSEERGGDGDAPVGMLTFDCPRCGTPAQAPYWGPCPTCRDDLAAHLGGEARQVEVVAYEPKVNVVPNQVATKE
jgi:hypothetical protein